MNINELILSIKWNGVLRTAGVLSRDSPPVKSGFPECVSQGRLLVTSVIRNCQASSV
jgi:hypothetical protein